MIIIPTFYGYFIGGILHFQTYPIGMKTIIQGTMEPKYFPRWKPDLDVPLYASDLFIDIANTGRGSNVVLGWALIVQKLWENRQTIGKSWKSDGENHREIMENHRQLSWGKTLIGNVDVGKI